MAKNEVDDFLANLSNETENDPFTQDSKDPFTIEDEVVEEVTEDEVEGKPLPFNKDPKIQRFIEKEVKRLTKDIQPTETENFVQETTSDDKLTDVLTRIIGNDTPEKLSAIKEFRNELSGLEEKGAQRALQQIQAQSEAERREELEAQEELSQAFENIEENFNVDLTSNTSTAKKTRNDFIDFVKRVSPKDEDGQVTDFPDFQETFALFKETQKPQSNNRAKELSSRSLSRSSDASQVPANGDKSWNAVERLFSKLTK